MVFRPKHETVEALRLTLRRLEDASDPAQDAGAFAELKQIILNRIAILQAQEPLAVYDDESMDRAA